MLCVHPQAVRGQALLWNTGALVDLVRGSNCHLLLVKVVIALVSSCTQSHGVCVMAVLLTACAYS